MRMTPLRFNLQPGQSIFDQVVFAHRPDGEFNQPRVGHFRILLRQERKDLEAEVKRLSTRLDMKALEKEFIEAAGPYGARKGIDYSTWRDAGVEPSVLSKAGIKRTRRS